MFIDIVFPDKNEKKFIERAILLGYDGICFVYPSKNNSSGQENSINSTELKLFNGLLADKPKNNKNYNLILINSKSPEIDRTNLEQGKFDIIFNLENNERSDYIHQRNSGLNQVFCKLAKTKQTAIGISFSNLLEQKSLVRAKFLGRIEQNLKLCKKYKVNVVFASFASKPEQMRSPNDFRAFVNCLCNNELFAKQSLTNLSFIVNENIKKKDKNYISKDVHILNS
ncbi:MAG: hypothetical protein KAQ83_03585 [Nanoarchaeota archaeon]|nr:hypothetical protein [Nanoarchaeota archaeon]